MHSYDPSEFPPELCAKPLALVGFSGLDTLNNAVHKAIWEMFSSNRRIERSPVLFKLISNAHEFPVVKPKRNSYEWYIPKGILKKNWINKHLNELPAVVAIFYDLDWNDPQWSEKMIECASRVQSLRAALEERNTRIVVVLIQDAPPLPPGEDVLGSDRAIALCASCELNAKSLFVLPHGDHLQGYVVRLESAFYDIAQNYYRLEAKNVKSHKEHLNKTTHASLFVRHQFKIAFLSELRQDHQTAHKHYTHAYNNLLEIRIIDTNALEIRTVAGFINYKLCRLMFLLGLARDAISQFRIHTDRFKGRLGFQELAFEHHAWLSKQFHVFGDIFDEAVKLGLPAVQTQHPGLYYQQAAQFALLRKKSCETLCANVKEYPQPDPLEGLKHLEFYGQRPWRQGKLTSEVLDPSAENRGIEALQFLEKQVNHSNIIISLFGLAISQYKTYRCLRMRRHLVVQMADEYYNSKDYGKALTLYTHMLWDYRSELWWILLTDILQKALKCSLLIGNVQDYVTISLELLGSYTQTTQEHKKQIYENLNRVLIKKVPEPELHIPEPDYNAAIKLWKQNLSAESLILTLDMSNVVSCIESKARFSENKYQGDQKVIVELFIRSTCPFFLKFSRVSITINTPDYSSEFAVDDREQDLGFNPMDVKRFLIDFQPNPQDVGKQMQIGAVSLQLGNKQVCLVDMKFNGMGNEATRSCPEFSHFRRGSKSFYDFDNMYPMGSALIVPRNSKLAVEFTHNSPALLEEWYEIGVVIKNEEEFAICDLEMQINLGDDGMVPAEQATEVASGDSTTPESTPLKRKIATLGQMESSKWKFSIRNRALGSRNIEVQITYLLQSNQSVASMKEETLTIGVVQPFEVTTTFVSDRSEPISKFYVGETFGVTPVISFQSPWPIVIVDSFLEPAATIEKVHDIRSQIARSTFQAGNAGTDLFMVKTTKVSDAPISVGKYVVKWKREKGKITVSEIPITGLSADWVPIYLENVLPAYGLVKTPLLITYRLYNRSEQVIQLDLNMDISEAFMFAGYKQQQISILPNSIKLLQYNMYPLMAGDARLPKLTLSVRKNSQEETALRQDQLDNLIERTLQPRLYIMPQVRGAAKVPESVGNMDPIGAK